MYNGTSSYPEKNHQPPRHGVRPIAAPKYEAIADDLRTQIIDGRLAPGTQLPTIAELRAKYSVADRTVFEAMQLLLHEGLVSSKPGFGYRVRERPSVIRMVRNWYRDASGKGSPWRAEMAAQGREGAWIARSTAVDAPPVIAERLHIAPGDRVMRTAYIFTVDGKPTYLSTSYEPLALTGGSEIMLPEDGEFAGQGVIDRYAAIGVTITECREELVPRTLTMTEADTLQLHPGIAILVIERTYYASEQPVETADIVMPPHYRPVYQIPVG